MSAAGQRIRAFVALEIDERMCAAIASAVSALKPKVIGIRWVALEGLHLTLRFLGPSRPETLDALAPALRAAAGACPAGEARVAGLGTFPERGSPRVLWLGVALPPPVLALQAACEAAAVAAGFEPEGRPFRSHLTLGRWRDRAPRPQLPELDLGTAPLERLALLRSELRPGGAVYTPLAVFPLGQP